MDGFFRLASGETGPVGSQVRELEVERSLVTSISKRRVLKSLDPGVKGEESPRFSGQGSGEKGPLVLRTEGRGRVYS